MVEKKIVMPGNGINESELLSRCNDTDYGKLFVFRQLCMENLEDLKDDLESYQEKTKKEYRYMFLGENPIRKQQTSLLIEKIDNLISQNNQGINDNRTLSNSLKELKKVMDKTEKDILNKNGGNSRLFKILNRNKKSHVTMFRSMITHIDSNLEQPKNLYGFNEKVDKEIISKGSISYVKQLEASISSQINRCSDQGDRENVKLLQFFKQQGESLLSQLKSMDNNSNTYIDDIYEMDNKIQNFTDDLSSVIREYKRLIKDTTTVNRQTWRQHELPENLSVEFTRSTEDVEPPTFT